MTTSPIFRRPLTAPASPPTIPLANVSTDPPMRPSPAAGHVGSPICTDHLPVYRVISKVKL